MVSLSFSFARLTRNEIAAQTRGAVFLADVHVEACFRERTIFDATTTQASPGVEFGCNGFGELEVFAIAAEAFSRREDEGVVDGRREVVGGLRVERPVPVSRCC